jgi:hypothetical protein
VVLDLTHIPRAAIAALQTAGGGACVRFYRRADGTVMTADCPTGARRSRRLTVVASTVAGAALAAASPAAADPAEPPPEPAPATVLEPAELAPIEPMTFDGLEATMGLMIIDPSYDDAHRPRIEWSSWVRLGYGTASNAPDGAARSSTPPPPDRDDVWEAALGADVSVGIARHGDLRLGAWTEARTSSGPVLGGELILEGAPGHLDLFQHDGEGSLSVRAGGNGHVVTAAIAYGYLAPWRLWGPWNGPTRYMIGVRLVASVTRSVDDPRDWSATAGLEFEPVGAVRYLLGVRDWY